jgi:hypothetical protein
MESRLPGEVGLPQMRSDPLCRFSFELSDDSAQGIGLRVLRLRGRPSGSLWKIRIPCMWSGITTQASKAARGWFPGIFNRSSATTSPAGERSACPSSTRPKQRARPWVQIVTL